ncbi:MAG: polysaccharide pyruvyl transferase family protein [Clostridia bacterium]|nr:polysaccharide pyruvyl transferase family protein [Clostridia bacterium]
MHRILFHAGLSPLDRPPLSRVFQENLFTNNSGNLLFQYGAYRTLMTEDVRITTAFFERLANGSKDDAARINETYDCAVMPMANNFRASYNLKAVTRFIRRLKIPCVVVGVGLQAPEESAIHQGFPFDDDVKAFVSAVLDRSAMLGLRGEMTAEYLQHLGFSPERHFTVVGCPSMYSHGPNLPPVKPLTNDPGAAVSFGYRIDQPEPLAQMLVRAMERFPNYHIVAQRREEMNMIRYGTALNYTYDKANRCAGLYPHDPTHPALREGRMVGFANAHAWIRFMQGMAMNMGSRIHGNIAAVLAGTPTLAITLDTRMEELCRYHNIPHIPVSRVDAEADPRSLWEGVDPDRVHQGHARRFAHFVDFLDANGLDHIYRNGADGSDAPMDRALAALPEWGMVAPVSPVPLSLRAEGFRLFQLQRLRAWHTALRKRLKRLRHS